MTKQKSRKTVKVSKSHEETFNIAKELASEVNSSLLIGLSGELGSGKTVFAKGFAEELEVKELVTSPTFLGINEYYSGRIPFIHMDFYKKVIAKEKIDLYIRKNSIILIEWIDNFSSVFNDKLEPDISVCIQYLKDKNSNILNNERQLTIDFINSKGI